MTHRIIDVKALEDFVVLAIFQNGVVKEYDVKILVNIFPQFLGLSKDIALFNTVKVDVGGYGISWTDELDLSAEEIWDNGVEKQSNCRVDIANQVGYKLTHARNEANITQKELADKLKQFFDKRIHKEDADIKRFEPYREKLDNFTKMSQDEFKSFLDVAIDYRNKTGMFPENVCDYIIKQLLIKHLQQVYLFVFYLCSYLYLKKLALFLHQ